MLNRNFCIPILSDGVVTISAVVAAFRFNKSPSEFIKSLRLMQSPHCRCYTNPHENKQVYFITFLRFAFFRFEFYYFFTSSFVLRYRAT